MTTTGDQSKQKIQAEKKIKLNNRPQDKDDLDSREREEQNTKGDDVSRNKKDKRKSVYIPDLHSDLRLLGDQLGRSKKVSAG